MIKPITYNEEIKKEILNRDNNISENVDEIVKAIIQDVKQNGDQALKNYTMKFDGLELEQFLVTENEMAEAQSFLSTDYIDMLNRAAKNIQNFHRKQLKVGFEIREEDCVIGQKVVPIESVAIYVPGGTAAYPSTVLMNAIPAKIAGVNRIIMVTPPNKQGKIKPEVLMAAKIAGVDEIYKIGGAQAVAALAYGTESIPKVNKITGPGNIFVATAKKLVFGLCGIDMIAGPSEILIVADDSANAKFVAADLLSQAEHDKLATSVLITNSIKIANEVATQIEEQLIELPRYAIANESVKNNCKIIVVRDLEEAILLSNELAPEHLELAVKDPFTLLEKVKNAGSVFLGNYTPEAVGDYYAGPNHTLPTSGTAKFSSPLSVDDFIKTTQYVYFSEEKLKKSSSDIEKFAMSEGLQAHAKSVTKRMI